MAHDMLIWMSGYFIFQILLLYVMCFLFAIDRSLSPFSALTLLVG